MPVTEGAGSAGTVAPAVRRAHLDNLKVVLTVAVIAAHAAMSYGALGSWIYEEPSLSEPVEFVLSLAVALGAMFGLGLFYLVAGVLTPGPLARRGSGPMLRNRLVRLGLPLLVYVVVVWPMLRWVVDRSTDGTTDFMTFMRKEFSGAGVWSLGSGPLWFVAVLLGLTAGWVLFRTVRPRTADVNGEGLSPRRVLGVALAIAVGSFVVRLEFPVDSPQFLDLHLWLWPQASVMFVLGAVGSERAWFESFPAATKRACGWLASFAIVALGLVYVLAHDRSVFAGGWHWEAFGLAAVEGMLAVAVSLLVLDWFRRRRDHYSKMGWWLARSSYRAFLLQGPVLVGLALVLHHASIPGDAKFVAVAVVGIAACYVGAHLSNGIPRQHVSTHS